jgi:hypothetical protein
VSERAFEPILASALALAERGEALRNRLQGLELADERGWLSDQDARALATGLEEQKEIADAFATALDCMRASCRERWKTWLLELCGRVEALPVRDAGLASAVETLRAEAEDRSTSLSLAWALLRGVKVGGASHAGEAR